MIQVAPGDLVAVSANGKYYYALLIERIRMFGGCWSYVFHRTSADLLSADQLLADSGPGFNAFVDFIWGKRDGRIQRLRRRVDTSRYRGPGFLKGTHPFQGKAPFWFLYDMAFNPLGRVSKLTAEQARYPYHETIDDALMVQRVDERWLPEQDPRI